MNIAAATSFPQIPAVQSPHIQEWLDSAVDPGIIALNVESLTDLALSAGGEVETPIHDRLNWSWRRYSRKTKEALRGWWVSGIAPQFKQDMFAGWGDSQWGRFKPDSDTPVVDVVKSQKKGYQVSAKYLSPAGAGTSRVTFLKIPNHIWVRIALRFGVEIGSATNCWEWVRANNLPVVLTEGEKKAGAILTQGIPAIALPGFRSAARTENKRYYLHADIEIFATRNRKIYVCFDHEPHPKKVKEIGHETEKLARLFARKGCIPHRIDLPGPDKGVDDFIAAQGDEAFERLFFNAIPLDSQKRFRRLPYRPNLTIDRPYLGDIPVPAGAKLIGIKSPKGTGKTFWLKSQVAQVQPGQRVLLITHRRQLGQAICASLPGVSWVDEAPMTQVAWDEQGIIGLGLCLDSMHPLSKARFDPAEWEDALIIIDESEQVFWHLLTARTEIKNHRCAVLDSLRTLLQNALLSNLGRVICLDADLSLSLEFVKSLSGLERLKPWVCVNDRKPQQWQVHRYNEHSPAAWFADIAAAAERGEKLYIATQAKEAESITSALNLETELLRRCPDLRILRIDADSVAEPGHPAQGCIENLNKILHQYDVVIATPVIETGVSINEALKITPSDAPLVAEYAAGRIGPTKLVIPSGTIALPDNTVGFISIYQGKTAWTPELHGDRVTLAMVTTANGRITEVADLRDPAEVFSLFDRVCGITFGVSGENQFRQALARVRDPIPRYIWAAKQSQIAQVGNKSTTPQALIRPQLLMASKTLEWVNFTAEGEIKFYPEALNYWAKWGAALNCCLQNYREYLFEALAEEGHFITEVNSSESLAAYDDLKIARDDNTKAKNAATIAAADIDERRFKELSDKRGLTPEERHTLRKAEIARKYRIPVTEELLQLDQKGWHPKVQLHYYLQQGRQHLKEREKHVAESNAKEGRTWALDLNKASLANKIQVLDILGIQDILTIDRPFSNEKSDDPYTPEHRIQTIVAKVRQHKFEIRDLLGFLPIEDTISEATGDVLDKSIAVLRQLLNVIGIKLNYEGRWGTRDNRRRHYTIAVAEDPRNEVFAAWLQRDAAIEQANQEGAIDDDF
jgi:Domain of unknown function (DUF3854)